MLIDDPARIEGVTTIGVDEHEIFGKHFPATGALAVYVYSVKRLVLVG